MSNTLAHGFLHQAVRQPNPDDPKKHQLLPSQNSISSLPTASMSNRSAYQLRTPLVSTNFYKGTKITRRKVSMIPCAVLAPNPASEQAGRYNLSGNSEMQVTVMKPAPTSPFQIDIHVSNYNDSLILHWGAIFLKEGKWTLPTRRPDGTKIYKDRALRTPFKKCGPNLHLSLEIDDPQIYAVEFLLFDEARNKWFKNNGHNFHIQLPRRDKTTEADLLPSKFSLPEDLLRIQAYLRWERKGKQAYTPAQEKEEFEAARTELLEEVARGTSIEELRARLTKKEEKPKETKKDEKPEKEEKPKETKKDEKLQEQTAIVEYKIPDELVQIQAYIRWEKAGKPDYSSEQQLREFEEARKELQLEVYQGTSIDELRKKILKGDIQTKVQKQLATKKYFTPERIQRKKRDLMQFLNKYVAQPEKKLSSPPIHSPTLIELWSNAMEEQDEGRVLNKKLFKLDDKEFLVLVTEHLGKVKIYAATDMNQPVTLHWGLSIKPGEWMAPSLSKVPEGWKMLDKACETPLLDGSKNISRKLQTLEIEIDKGNFLGMPFALKSNGTWIRNNGSDFYVEFDKLEKVKKDIGDGKGTAKALLDRIAGLEVQAERSLMHRFNIAADLTESAKDAGELGFAGILVWMRFMATRQLTWNRNFNVKPREISTAQERFTDSLQNIYKSSPHFREIIRMIMSAVGRGGEGNVGQRIRDEILVIQRNNDCKGGMMEEWHQKLHNNTSPDDVVICQALIEYIKSDFDIDVYWKILNSNGITKERLLSYDRAIHSEPNFRRDQKQGLLRDLGKYLRTLKAVHSGADLESAIATCLGYKSEGQGFMVGVRINPISDLSSGYPEILQFVLEHTEDKTVEPLLEGLLEARAELRPLLLRSHDRLKDLIFLDIALDSAVRTAVERGYEELKDARPEKIMYFISLVLENLALSSDNNEDLIYCLKGWNCAIDLCRSQNDEWALYAKSVLDRTRLALASKAEHYQNILQPSAEYLGNLLGVDQWAINMFTEEIIRAGSAASLSSLLNRLDPVLRQTALLGSWQVISPVEVAGYVDVVDKLLTVQNKSFERPTILVAKSVKGEEEIPENAVAVLTPDMPDVLSHVSVRARNSKVCFATCFDPNILLDLQSRKGKPLRLKPTSADVIYSEIKDSELGDSRSLIFKDGGASKLNLNSKQFGGKYAISADEFTTEAVGAKSRNISFLKGKVPAWIGVPTSVALPFGVFEKILSDNLNEKVSTNLSVLKTRLGEGDFSALDEIRKTVMELVSIPQMEQELKDKMKASGMPWPGDESHERWQQAWSAIKQVWASKWNERAYFSIRKLKLEHDNLCMSVLVQEVISADYAFVIHTTNPSTGDSSEIYAEVVKGLGETLVGAYPGRALSFVCKKTGLNSPKVLGYPSKPIGLFIKHSLIFRSDSNGEDLEGYAGAGLYDSVLMDKVDKVVLDYTTDPLITDAEFRKTTLSSIVRAGKEIEELFGAPQDIEGVVKNGKIFVVQTRPQM